MVANLKSPSKVTSRKGLVGLVCGFLALSGAAQAQVFEPDQNDQPATSVEDVANIQEDLVANNKLWAAAFNSGPSISGQLYITPLNRSFSEGVSRAPEDQADWQARNELVFGAKLYFKTDAGRQRADNPSYLDLLAPKIARGQPSKFYVFLAGSGNMLSRSLAKESSGPEWLLSQDDRSDSAGVTQLGIGWQTGPVELSLGYMDKNYKNAHLLKGMNTHHEGVAGLTFSFRPR